MLPILDMVVMAGFATSFITLGSCGNVLCKEACLIYIPSVFRRVHYRPVHVSESTRGMHVHMVNVISGLVVMSRLTPKPHTFLYRKSSTMGL